MTTLYKKDSKGVMRQWHVYPSDDGLEIAHGHFGGAMQYKHEKISAGLGGRSLESQINSRIDSRIKNQMDKGYVLSLSDAQKGPTNQLGLKIPMLATPLKRVNKIDFKQAFYQHKYNGHRCLMYHEGNDIVAYSRKGIPITSIDHILEHMKLPEGAHLDGELYHHGSSLQKISSWIKRKQANTKKLTYIIYDQIAEDPFFKRFIDALAYDTGTCSIFARTFSVNSLEECFDLYRKSRSEGYEGGIVRWGNEGYRDDHRSKGLVKFKKGCDSDKPLIDCEVTVVDIIPSKDGWARLVCAFGESKLTLSAPGPIVFKHHVMANSEKYIGRSVTIEYAELTDIGIPFHAVAREWKEEL